MDKVPQTTDVRPNKVDIRGWGERLERSVSRPNLFGRILESAGERLRDFLA
jgi:hypothetical protein